MRILFTLLVFIFTGLSAQAAARPKLVVVLVIDQFRSDYLTRFERYFGKSGLRYFTEKGAYFMDAQTNHAYNVTAVGHATILTGAYPYLHGIIANNWYDVGIGHLSLSVQDPSTQLVVNSSDKAPPGADTGRSPKNLLVSTVGDELKNSTGGKATVVSIALKDRAAILLGGHRPDLALWLNDRFHPGKFSGEEGHFLGWVTSTYYVKRLPEWLERWNKSSYVGKKVPKEWTMLLPKAEYAATLETPLDAIGEANGLGKEFPHAIQGKIPAFITSPWGSSYTLDTALEAAKNMKLGSHSVPDLLAVSLSSFDILGHNYGVYSPEMMDATVRLDRAIAGFIAELQKLVPGGLSNITFVLTADHGIQENPGFAEKFHLPGGTYWPEDWANRANAQLRDQFGFGKDEKPILSFFETNVVLDPTLLRKSKKDPKEIARALATWLRSQPFIAAAYAKTDLLDGHIPPTAIAQKLARNTHPDRSGDVVFAVRPGYVQLANNVTAGTEHESPTVQDASIPMIFVGAAFKPGRYHQMIYLNDLAPTLSSVLGIIPPSANEGRVLGEALK